MQLNLEQQRSNNVTAKNLLRKLSLNGYRCFYTGLPINTDNVGADHMQPRSRGGNDLLDNVAMCLRVVNTAKGTMNTEEFLGMCLLVSDIWEHGVNDTERCIQAFRKYARCDQE